MKKVIITTLASTLILAAATMAQADQSSRYTASGDTGYTASDFLEVAAAEPVAGRNDRVTHARTLLNNAFSKSIKSNGKQVAVDLNPGSVGRGAASIALRKLFKGVNPHFSVFTSTKISGRFMHKGRLYRFSILLNGKGHAGLGDDADSDIKLSSIHMTPTKENWKKAAEELRKRLEALKNNA